MSDSLLKGLCTLFSRTSNSEPFEKAPMQPFADALTHVKKALESSDNPKWKALAVRLETSSTGSPSYNNNGFIYPISHTENDVKKNCPPEMYIRKSTLNDLNQVCIEALKTTTDQDLRGKFWDVLIEGTKIIEGDTPRKNAGAGPAKTAQNQQELAFKSL